MKARCLLLLSLLATAVLCDEKPSAADVGKGQQQRQQRRADVGAVEKPSPKAPPAETLQPAESKYAGKAEVVHGSVAAAASSQQKHRRQRQQQYHRGPAAAATGAGQELGNQPGDYAELPSYGDFQYARQRQQRQFVNQDKYRDNEGASAYLHQSAILMNSAEQQQQQEQQEQQYYGQEGRGNAQNDYERLQQQHHHHQPQQLYQQEVTVGNQLQSSQQKAVTQKYLDGNDDKGAYYLNIPMSHLLAYYHNYGMLQPKSKSAEQQISVPVYMPLLATNQVYTPAKVTYQPEVEYVPTYQKHTEAIFTKEKSGRSQDVPIASSTLSSASSKHSPAASQEYSDQVNYISSAYAAAYQPQAYLQYSPAQHEQESRQQQQQQQIVYGENPAPLTYADLYNAPATAYVQDNYLYEQQQQQQQQQNPHGLNQFYVSRAIAEQLMAQILRQAGLQASAPAAQEIDKAQEEVPNDYSSSQYEPQKIQNEEGVTHILPVSSENEDSQSKSVYTSTTSSEPKTLLDSYVPSHVIAAQDTHRYRERPIKLESGFLPSKINFIGSYKKSKTE